MLRGCLEHAGLHLYMGYAVLFSSKDSDTTRSPQKGATMMLMWCMRDRFVSLYSV